MSVPKKRISKRRTRARRSHHKATAVHGITSPIPGDDSVIRLHHSHEYNGKLYTWKELKKMMRGEVELPEAPAEEAPAKETPAAEAPAEPEAKEAETKA